MTVKGLLKAIAIGIGVFAWLNTGNPVVGLVIFGFSYIAILVFSWFAGLFGISSSGRKRDFACDNCGSKYWITTDVSKHEHDDEFRFREWIQCEKCGNTEVNDKWVRK